MSKGLILGCHGCYYSKAIICKECKKGITETGINDNVCQKCEKVSTCIACDDYSNRVGGIYYEKP